MNGMHQAYNQGQMAALAKFKLANIQNMLQQAQHKGVAKVHPGLRNPQTFMSSEKSVAPAPKPAVLPAKTGAIFGEHEPEGLDHAAIPHEDRQRMYDQYLKTKGQEAPTGYLKSMLTGGGIGALAGGLMGGGSGAAIGGGLGALGGAALAHGDKSKIQDAQHALNTGTSRDALNEHILGLSSNDEMRDSLRHHQLMQQHRPRQDDRY